MSWNERPTVELNSGVTPEALANEFKLPLWIAGLLHSRMKNWLDTSLDAARRFMQPSLKNLPDPFALLDMDRAAERVVTAICENEPIAIYGDYDVDGTVGSAVLMRFFRMLGVDVTVYQPDRQREGYGVNANAVRMLAENGARLLITVDCGITAVTEVDIANSLGLDVIVCDHHEQKDVLPDAYAVLDHKRKDYSGPINVLCGAGVAFYLALAVRSMLRDIDYFSHEGAGKKEPDLRALLDLVAVATVADMVPLVEENRVLVTYGLEKLRKSPTLGLAELFREAGVKQEDISTYHIGFVIGPRINASGRLASASAALELLTTDDPMRARALASELGGMNKERMELQAHVADAAILQAAEQLEKYGADLAAFVLAGEDWHEGVIGIAASRVVERYHRPVVIITFATHTGNGKGSIRGLGKLDMLQALEGSAELLLGFGGHKVAAGLSLERKNLESFRERFAAQVREQLNVLLENGVDALARKVEIDAKLDLPTLLSTLDLNTVKIIDKLAPFGIGNPEPVLSAEGFRIEESRTMKEKHLKLQLEADGNFVSAFWANGVERFESSLEENEVELAFSPTINTFRNQNNVEFRVKDIRALSH